MVKKCNTLLQVVYVIKLYYIFQCTWCPVVKRCSTGMDRFRQDWLHKECDKIESGNISNCNLPDPKHSQQTSADSASVRAGLQVISDDGKCQFININIFFIYCFNSK